MPDSFQQKPTSLSVTDADAEICLNTWVFVDSTAMVIRIAAKAYALKGTDEEKLTILKSLAGTDHLTATQGRIPTKYSTKLDGQDMAGTIPFAAIQSNPIPVFEDLFTEIEKSLPQLYRAVNDQYEPFKLQLTESFIWVMTSVFESNDGQLIARISQ